MEPERNGANADLARVCLTVSQLNRAVSGSLQREFGLQRVRGEIASFVRAASGHWYFALKDAGAQVRCVMFRGRNSAVDFAPREGDEVEVHAAVALYEARGEFQLTVESLRRFGAGRLWEEFLRLRQRLAAEGLFSVERKRPLPRLPRAVGVATSLQAAALRDVLATLRRRAPYLQIVVYPVPVQGLDAGARIAAMLEAVSRRCEVDVLLLVRGGGSIEDLWAFNEEVVARAIRASSVPIIVGVGHESDFTIADFAADVRAPTPTAAAELVAPERSVLLREIAVRVRALGAAGTRLLAQRAQRIDYAVRILGAPRAPLRGLESRIADLHARMGAQAAQHLRRYRQDLAARLRSLRQGQAPLPLQERRVADLTQRLRVAQQRGVERAKVLLAHRQRALAHLNVQAVLERGFSILRDAHGAPLTDAARLAPGDAIAATLARGSAQLRVENAKPHEG